MGFGDLLRQQLLGLFYEIDFATLEMLLDGRIRIRRWT